MNFKVCSLATKVAKKNVLISICWRRYQESALLLLSSLTLALGWGAAIPSAFAAERVTLHLGPFSPSVAVADLEEFAKSGELPSPLKVYAPVLTPQVREVLNRRLQLDPNLGDKLIKDVVRSPTGERLLNILGVAIPGSSLEQLQAAMAIALRQANGLSVVGFLRAYPTENITLDVGSAVAIAAQLNPTYLQSQVFGSLLESELAVKSDITNAAFDPAAPGTQTVLKQTLTLQDRQRNRTIRVDVYWDKGIQPNGQATGPLVIISHGFGADRKFLTYLARHLASHGLTVAALEHPGSDVAWLNRVSAGTSDGKVLPATEFVDRPKDVSFLLDQLAKLNQESATLQGRLNTEQVSVIGHSLGGYTALALAGAEVNPSELRQSCKDSLGVGQAPGDWLQCAAANLPDRELKLRDQQVKNIIALNPLVGQLFGKTGLTQVETPVLMLAGTEDALTPFSTINYDLLPNCTAPNIF